MEGEKERVAPLMVHFPCVLSSQGWSTRKTPGTPSEFPRRMAGTQANKASPAVSQEHECKLDLSTRVCDQHSCRGGRLPKWPLKLLCHGAGSRNGDFQMDLKGICLDCCVGLPHVSVTFIRSYCII